MNTLPSGFNEAVYARWSSVVSVEGRGNGFFMGSALGQSLLMTCEHVVRDTLAKGKEEVTLHIPSLGSDQGRILLDDAEADVAVVMLSDDSVISGEALEFSDIAAASGRDVVMLGFFSMGSDIMNKPGTSHGYAKETITTGNVQHLVASYTAKPGNSGSPVCIVENGDVRVVGMMCHCTMLEYEDGRCTQHQRKAVTVASIQTSLRNKVGPAAEGLSIQEMVPLIIRSALYG